MAGLFLFSCSDGGGSKPNIITTLLPPATLDHFYEFQLLVEKNPGNIAWSLDSGSLPDNISLSSSGLLYGTPTVVGNWSFTIKAKGGSGSRRKEFTLRVRELAQWTVMVMLDGDNDLERNTPRIFQELESVGSSNNVNIVVQWDRIDGYDSTTGDWTETRRYYVIQDSSEEIASGLIIAPSQKDLSNAAELVDFVTSSAALLPAERYAFFVYDHGGNWRGGFRDDTTGALMNSSELASAFSIITATLGDNVDLVGLDECCMASVEVSALLSPYVSWLLASERFIHNGFDYATPLFALSANPEMNASTLAASFVSSYDSYAVWSGEATLSAVDLSKIGNVVSSADNFFEAIGDGDNETLALARALVSAQGFSPLGSDYLEINPPDSTDLYDIGFIASETFSNATVQQAAWDLMNAVEEAVPFHSKHSMVEHMRGLTLYYPVGTSPYLAQKNSYLALLGLSGLASATWPADHQDFFDARDSMLVPLFSSFNVNGSVCDFSDNTSASFQVVLTRENAWCVDARFVLDNDVWYNGRYFPRTTISGGRTAAAAGWTGSNLFEWNGLVRALDNGTHACRFTSDTQKQKRQGTIYGEFTLGGVRDEFTMFYDIETGQIFTFTNSSWTFMEEPPEGAVIEPWTLKNTSGGAKVGESFDGGLLVGPGGVTLKWVEAPTGDYDLAVKLRDALGAVTDVESGVVTLQD